MIAKFSEPGKSFVGILNYNEKGMANKKKSQSADEKVSDSIISERILVQNFISCGPDAPVRSLADELKTISSENKRITNPTFHVALSFAYSDKVSNVLLRNIAVDFMQLMGYGSQPFVVYRHHDKKHDHIHIVSTRVGIDAKKIDHNFEKRKAFDICRKFEIKYNLQAVPAFKERETVYKQPITEEIRQKSSLKNAIKTNIQALLKDDSITTLEELEEAAKQLNFGFRVVEIDKNGNQLEKKGIILYRLEDEYRATRYVKGRDIGKGYAEKLLALMENRKRKYEVTIEWESELRKKTRVAKLLSDIEKIPEISIKQLSDIFVHNGYLPEYASNSGGIYGLTLEDITTGKVYKASELSKELSFNKLRKKINNSDQSTTKENVDKASDTHSKLPRFSGELVEHGAAPYEHDPENKPSYYVTLKGKTGEEKTIWGVGLEEPMNEGYFDIGDIITLVQSGRKEVKIMTPIRKAGEIVGYKETSGYRNDWQVLKFNEEKSAAFTFSQDPIYAEIREIKGLVTGIYEKFSRKFIFDENELLTSFKEVGIDVVLNTSAKGDCLNGVAFKLRSGDLVNGSDRRFLQGGTTFSGAILNPGFCKEKTEKCFTDKLEQIKAAYTSIKNESLKMYISIFNRYGLNTQIIENKLIVSPIGKPKLLAEISISRKETNFDLSVGDVNQLNYTGQLENPIDYRQKILYKALLSNDERSLRNLSQYAHAIDIGNIERTMMHKGIKRMKEYTYIQEALNRADFYCWYVSRQGRGAHSEKDIRLMISELNKRGIAVMPVIKTDAKGNDTVKFNFLNIEKPDFVLNSYEISCRGFKHANLVALFRKEPELLREMSLNKGMLLKPDPDTVKMITFLDSWRFGKGKDNDNAIAESYRKYLSPVQERFYFGYLAHKGRIAARTRFEQYSQGTTSQSRPQINAKTVSTLFNQPVVASGVYDKEFSIFNRSQTQHGPAADELDIGGE